VKEFENTNPHSWLYESCGRQRERYLVGIGAKRPRAMMRAGIKANALRRDKSRCARVPLRDGRAGRRMRYRSQIGRYRAQSATGPIRHRRRELKRSNTWEDSMIARANGHGDRPPKHCRVGGRETACLSRCARQQKGVRVRTCVSARCAKVAGPCRTVGPVEPGGGLIFGPSRQTPGHSAQQAGDREHPTLQTPNGRAI